MADYIPGALSSIGIQTGRNVAGVDRERSMAEMAARQFDEIGSDNARYWASQLRQDPRAAFMAAQQYGGVGAVERALRGSVAQGRAAATLSQVMSPAQLAVYQQYGPQGLKQMTEAQGGAGLQPEDFRGLRTGRERAAKDFGQLYTAYKMASAADVDSPEWGQAMTILFNKVLQPNSAVLEGEAQATAQAFMSMAEQLGLLKEGVFNPQAPVSREGRIRMQAVIEDLAEVGLTEYASMHDRWKVENARMGIQSGSNRDYHTRPEFARVDEILGDLAGIKRRRSQRASAPVSDARVPASREPVGAVRQMPDGSTYKKTADGWVLQ